MLRTLIRLRAKLWWAGEGSDRTVFWVATVLLLGILVAGLWGMRLAFSILIDQTAHGAEALLLVIFLVTGVFRVLSAVRHGVERLYLAPDLELLLAAPIRTRTLFGAKVIEVAAAAPQSLAAMAIAGFTYGQARGSPLTVLLSVPIAVAFAVAATVAGLVLVILLVRVVPPARLQVLIAVVPVLFFAPMILAPQLLARPGSGPRIFDHPEEAIAGLRTGLAWLPTSWPAEALASLADGRWVAFMIWVAVTAAVVVGVWTAGLTVFVGTFLAGWGRVHEHAPRSRRSGLLPRLIPPFPRPMRAIILKDWLIVTRDLKMAAGLFFIVPFFAYILFRATTRADGGVGPMIVMAPIFASSVLGQAFVHEGRALSLLRASPVSAEQIFFGKLAAMAVPIAVPLWGVLIVTPVVGTISSGVLVVAWVSATVGLAGAGAISLAAAVYGTNLRRDPPQVQPLIGLAAALGIMIFLAPNIGLAAWLQGAARGTVPAPFSHPVVGATALVATAAAWWLVVALVRHAIRRLDALELA